MLARHHDRRLAALAATGTGVFVMLAVPAPVSAVAPRVVTTAGATTATPTTADASATIGDHCLVGRWRDSAQTFTVGFHHRYVAMHGAAGAVERDFSDGRTVTNWSRAVAARGSLDHHRLTVSPHGMQEAVVTAYPSANVLTVTQSRTRGFSYTFRYRGTTTRRTVRDGASRPTYQSGYACSRHSYVDSLGTSRRLSTTP